MIVNKNVLMKKIFFPFILIKIVKKNSSICYECYYNNHSSHIDKCILVIDFDYNEYKDYLLSFIQKTYNLIELKINEIYSFLNNLKDKHCKMNLLKI